MEAKHPGSKFSVDNKISPVGEVGIDYYFNSHWLVNASLSYTTMTLTATAKGADINGEKNKYDFSPVVARLNIGYRF